MLSSQEKPLSLLRSISDPDQFIDDENYNFPIIINENKQEAVEIGEVEDANFFRPDSRVQAELFSVLLNEPLKLKLSENSQFKSFRL